MLHDYVEPAERLVACPNQDVASGFGLLAAEVGPVVLQVPDFGDRFWVYQAVDQRSDGRNYTYRDILISRPVRDPHREVLRTTPRVTGEAGVNLSQLPCPVDNVSQPQ